VSDAGTPGISDPGERVVQAALRNGFRVESVPGPTALIAALTASGFPTRQFQFAGFIGHKPGERAKSLHALKLRDVTTILYESPYRIEKLLEELKQIFPQNQIVLAREITKKFEEYLRGTAQEILHGLGTRTLKGEFVVLIAPSDYNPNSALATEGDDGDGMPR